MRDESVEKMAVQEPSSYVSNMMLPEMVKATRLHPLGPDCIISNTEVTDKALLNSVQYYWYISHAEGCVECTIKKSNVKENVIASDPQCVITRKHRRFEAYCCMICRSNFVTIVQALLHLKAMHRSSSKILIQDKDVFGNIDKAMEVPPVPLPWHIAKKLVELEKTTISLNSKPTFLNVPNDSLSIIKPKSSSDGLPPLASPTRDAVKVEPSLTQSVTSQKQHGTLLKNSSSCTAVKHSQENVMLCLINAIVLEFNKPLSHLAFNDDCSEVVIKFGDGTDMIAKTPDLTKAYVNGKLNENIEESEKHVSLTFMVHYEQPSSKNSTSKDVVLRANNPSLARRLFANNFSKEVKHRAESLHILPASEPHPDPENGHISSEKICAAETKSIKDKPVAVMSVVNRAVKSVRFQLGAPGSSDDEKSDVQKNGLLTNKVDKMIPTTTTGRMLSHSLTSPLAAGSVKPASTSASLTAVGFSPALSEMAQMVKGKKLRNSLTRVQSWSPLQEGALFSAASMCRPFTSRGYTYAEKIELMKQKNDYDEEFTTKHIRKTGSPPTSNSTSVITQSQGNISNDTHINSVKKGKRRKNYKFSSERSVQNSENDSSSDGENKLSNLRFDYDTTCQTDDGANDDSDDTPPTLLGNVNVMSYASLLQSGLLTSSIFPSEYYGSGEWATAAMETLKSLQSSIKSQEEASLDFSKKHFFPQSELAEFERLKSKEVSEADVAEDRVAKVDGTQHLMESLSDDNMSTCMHSSGKLKLYAKLNGSRKRCRSSNELNTNDLPYPTQVAAKRHKLSASKAGIDSVNTTTDSESPFNFPQERLNDDMPVSNPDGIELHKLSDQVFKASFSLFDSSDIKGNTLYNHESNKPSTPPHSFRSMYSKLIDVNNESQLLSHLIPNMLKAKSSSDPALNSSFSESSETASLTNRSMSNSRVQDLLTPLREPFNSKLSSTPNSVDHRMVATAGDNLTLIDNVASQDIEDRKLILAKLQRSKKNTTTQDHSIKKTDIPEMFQNCVETLVKVQIVERVYACKVCGFTATGTDDFTGSNTAKALQTHVMEHSLKELYATGCEMDKW